MKSLRKGNSSSAESENGAFKYFSLTSIFVILLSLGVALKGYGQDDRSSAGQQQNEPSGLVAQSIAPTVAPYSEEIRNNILTVTQYPEVLEKVARIREYTTEAFQNTIQGYSQKKQNWFYEVSRYPELMHTLATLPRKQSRAQVNALLNNPSRELQEAAWKLYKRHHSELVEVDNLNQQAVTSFQDLIAPLNQEAQSAFRALEEMPDVLSILNDHKDLTARLGEDFKNDPEGTRQKLADLHDRTENENKQDLANYQKDLSQDPQAQKEYDLAAQAYAKSHGYSYPAPTGDKVINYYSNPYSYWFGYPYWYGSPIWYPGAYAFGGGFYYGMGGFPTLGFSNWFFGGAYRYYPHLYRTCGNYYRNHYIARGRYISPRNGFMSAAGRHYNPQRNYRPGWSSSSRIYSSPGRAQSQGLRPNAGFYNRSYNAPGGYSSPRTYSGSSFRSSSSYGGGVSRGYSGGGSRGGGSSRGGRR